MNTKHFNDQRGVAMLLELVLVAVVLGLVGLAAYQANHHAPTAANTIAPPAPSSAAGLAASAAAVVDQDSASDSSLSAGADATASELGSADSDVDNLGGSFDANSF